MLDAELDVRIINFLSRTEAGRLLNRGPFQESVLRYAVKMNSELSATLRANSEMRLAGNTVAVPLMHAEMITGNT